MDNPFINFNKTHTPTEECLYMLLSKLPIRENNFNKENINSESTLVKSPISWSMPWAWAGAFSAAGAMAALVFMLTNTKNIDTTAGISNNNNTSVHTVAKSNAENSKIENRKVKNTIIIDEALATVSGLENMSPDNKF